jgi:hypothetical protein
MSQETDPTFSGMVRLYAPYGASVDGVQYLPDADDIIVVLSAHAVDLLSFPPICPEASRPLPGEDDPGAEIASLRMEVFDAGGMVAARDKRIVELEAELRAERKGSLPPLPAVKPVKS